MSTTSKNILKILKFELKPLCLTRGSIILLLHDELNYYYTSIDFSVMFLLYNLLYISSIHVKLFDHFPEYKFINYTSEILFDTLRIVPAC